MPCFHPLTAHRDCATGAVRIVKAGGKGELQLPCGQCVGCRLERSRQWAVRMMHESSLHLDNCFITLTYSPENLPADLSLNKRHFQLFMKRLRKRVGPLRFFHCGEYGDGGGRPHYHAILFGYDFPDKVFYSERGGVRLYRSPLLESLWNLGFCTVGAVSFESCAYVARYVMKKVTGDAAESHYSRVNCYGEVYSILPEYVTMSRRPGIASDWFRKFGNEVFPSDEVISRGFPSRPPRYYDQLLAGSEPSVFDFVKRKRVSELSERAQDLTPARLKVREICAKARVAILKRPLG